MESSWSKRTTLGGYAEAHYNNLKGEGGAGDKKEIDLHRVALFLGHVYLIRAHSAEDDRRFRGT